MINPQIIPKKTDNAVTKVLFISSNADQDGLWQYDWFPTKGENLSAKIYYEGKELNCGVFEIDAVKGNFSSGGDIITIKALAAGIRKDLRTLKFAAHEKKTLREIANSIAAKYGFTVVGNIPDVRVERKTQYQKTDLHFLQGLANEYGYTFSLRGTEVTFTNMFELENQDAALTFKRKDIISLDVEDKTAHIYNNAILKYHNPKKKSTIVYEQKETNPAFQDNKGDTLVIRKRVENEQQAETLTRVALYNANSLKQEGNLDTTGNALLVAGVCVQVEEVGMFSGKYYVAESIHTVDRDGGYSTSAQIKRVSLIDKSLYKG